MPVQRFAPMTKDFPTFDCDAHVTEPALIWERAKDFLTRDELEALKRTIWWDADGRLLIVNGRAGVGLGSPRKGGSGRFKNLEGAAHIEVKEIVGVFFATIFVDTMPRSDVNDGIAAAKYFGQRRPVQNRPCDKDLSLFQIPWRANIQNDGRITPVEQPWHESPPEISRPSCQKHLHGLLRHLRLRSVGLPL
jgi:hypothetical protein